MHFNLRKALATIPLWVALTLRMGKNASIKKLFLPSINISGIATILNAPYFSHFLERGIVPKLIGMRNDQLLSASLHNGIVAFFYKFSHQFMKESFGTFCRFFVHLLLSFSSFSVTCLIPD